MNDKMREAFEACADNLALPKGRLSDDTYSNGITDHAWRVWQAAAQCAIPAGWQLVPIEPTPEMLASQHKDAAKIVDPVFRSQVLPWMDDNTRALWAELLAAAPRP